MRLPVPAGAARWPVLCPVWKYRRTRETVARKLLVRTLQTPDVRVQTAENVFTQKITCDLMAIAMCGLNYQLCSDSSVFHNAKAKCHVSISLIFVHEKLARSSWPIVADLPRGSGSGWLYWWSFIHQDKSTTSQDAIREALWIAQSRLKYQSSFVLAMVLTVHPL